MEAFIKSNITCFAFKFIKKGGDCIADWLVRIFTVCMDHGKVPVDWQNACLVPLHKSKKGKWECLNYKDESFVEYPW